MLCIDWKRARKESLEPLLSGKIAEWHPFNLANGIGLADYVVTKKPAPIIIIDGIYSSKRYIIEKSHYLLERLSPMK